MDNLEIREKSLLDRRTETDIISDDCDIIPPTPTGTYKKNLKKKRVKHKKREDTTSKLQVGNYITTLSCDVSSKCKIENTRTGTFDFNKPYIYHRIEEVLRYSENCFLKNNNIHVIGTYNFNSKDGYHLTSCPQSQIKIALDLTVAPKLPNEHDIISVFGSVEFSKNVPVIVVKFIRQEVEITLGKYMENLKLLRDFIPSDYFKTITSSSTSLNPFGKI